MTTRSKSKLDANIDEFLRRKKFLSACGHDSQLYSLNNYNKFYLKHALIELIKYDKPIIITGYIKLNPYDDYYSFCDIKPFYPEYEDTMIQLCGHVNILKKNIDIYINFYDNKNYDNEMFVLICRPYIYKNKEGEARGGLSLTNELGISPIMFYEEALDKVRTINSNKYVDFYQHRNGYFLGISSLDIEQQKSKQKKHEKYLRRQEKKNDMINLPFLNQKVFPLEKIEEVSKPMFLDYLFIEI